MTSWDDLNDKCKWKVDRKGQPHSFQQTYPAAPVMMAFLPFKRPPPDLMLGLMLISSSGLFQKKIDKVSEGGFRYGVDICWNSPGTNKREVENIMYILFSYFSGGLWSCDVCSCVSIDLIHIHTRMYDVRSVTVGIRSPYRLLYP